jgi:hypothetical protein
MTTPRRSPVNASRISTTRNMANAAALASVAALMMLAACTDDESSSDAATLDEFCSVAEQLNNQDSLPTREQLAEYQSLAPDEIAEPTATLVAAFESAADNPQTVFANDGAIAAIQELTAFEAEECGLEPPENAAPPETALAPQPPSDTATVLPFVDDFDNDLNGWGGPFQRFADGAYVWELPSGQSDARSADTLIEVEDAIDDAIVTATFSAVGVQGVGIQCAYEELDGSSRWYDLELGTDGAVIRKRPPGTESIEQLAANAAVKLTDLPTEIVAECWRDADVYRLQLTVDGALAAEASDPEPFGRAGAPNLSVRAEPTDAETPEHIVRFERFEVTDHPGS